MKPTWEQVKARSAANLGGLNCFCWDCELFFSDIGFGCLKHTTEEERADRAEAARARMAEVKLP